MPLLSVTEASALIAAQVPRLPTREQPLRQLAGSVLAETIAMERDQPPFDRVTMDGFAINSRQDVAARPILGTQAAGAAPLTLADSNGCIEVMTGAELPTGADCVIPVEQVSVSDGTVTLNQPASATSGLNIHRRGSDAHQHQAVIAPGTRLTATEIAVIASAGRASAVVCPAPRMALVSTGDELVEPGQPIQSWQVRRSNTYALHAALALHGFGNAHDVHVRDDLPSLRSTLEQLLQDHDVLVLSGGVSMGKFDFVPRVLAELGVHCVFQSVAQRPGKPLWFGIRADGKAVFALPGNPVSTIVCLHRYVIPGLLTMMGHTAAVEHIALGAVAEPLPTLTLFLPVQLHTNAVGITTALPMPTRGSGDFMSLLGTHGFVQLPPATTPIAAGTIVPLVRW